MIKKIVKSDIFIRACKTFIQGFLGSLIFFLNNNTNFDEKMVKSAIIGALARGLSALMNFILEIMKKGSEKNV